MEPAERDQVQRVFAQARRAGLDPLERADQLSLILTNKMRVHIQQLQLWKLSDALENADIHSILTKAGRTGNTALDAQRAIVAWIRDQAQEMGK